MILLDTDVINFHYFISVSKKYDFRNMVQVWYPKQSSTSTISGLNTTNQLISEIII